VSGSEYVKINTMFKRNMADKGRIIEGDWSDPVFGYLADNQWVFTEKVDGTNVRVIWDGDQARFGGRTDDAQMPVRLLDALKDKFTPELMRQTFRSGGFVLYGEGVGPKVGASSGKYAAEPSFVLFDVLAENPDSSVQRIWLERRNVDAIAEGLGIAAVPVVGQGTLHDAVKIVKGSLRSTWGSFEAEGIVARPAVELLTRRGERVITKIKARDFR
jgi:ATP-dependent RNA circularization protein (DNA/RNA ligase family)